LTDKILDTEWSFAVFGVGLLLVSIIVFVIYFRRKRWM
jgi:LPXTG-motif cell wall-anchored protein